jgi:hypothetical protein
MSLSDGPGLHPDASAALSGFETAKGFLDLASGPGVFLELLREAGI